MTVAFYTSLLRAGDVLEDVPLADVAYTRKLGGSSAGDFTAKLLLVDSAGSYARAQALLDATTPWRCCIWAEVDGQLRWGGPIVSRPYSSGQGSIDLKAAELSAYFQRRTVQRDRTFTAQDQLLIQRTLYSDVMSSPGGDVGLQLGALSSGVLRDRSYLQAQRKPAEQASAELSNVANGFDYAWVPVLVGNLPRIALAQGYPTLGGAQLVELQYPGDVLAFGFPEEGAALATMSWAIGKQDQATNVTPQASSTAVSLLDGGYPLLERSESYNEVSDAATLQAHADADVLAQAGTMTQVDVDVLLSDLYASGLDLGNVARLRITDPARFPAGADLQLRVVSITERPLQGTATISCADRLLTGGRLPSSGGAIELLASLARRLTLVETV